MTLYLLRLGVKLIMGSLIAGIAGVNPFEGTTGSVGLARFAVQVALAWVSPDEI